MPTQEILLPQDLVIPLVVVAVGLAVVAALVASLSTVEQRTITIVQRLGKFVREAGAGLHAKMPVIDRTGKLAGLACALHR